MHLLRILAVAGLVSFCAATSFADEGIAWQTDLDEARAESQKSGRPLLLFITSSHCAYCVKMKNDTFRNEAVIAELNEHFVPLQIDRGSQPALERKLGVQVYPTIVIVDDVDVEVRRIRGYVSSGAFVQNLKKIEAEWLAARPRPGTTVK